VYEPKRSLSEGQKEMKTRNKAKSKEGRKGKNCFKRRKEKRALPTGKSFVTIIIIIYYINLYSLR
jgi:hypothetical protein